MKVFFLGTNGWYDTHTGNTSCVLIESEEYYIIFDAGNGIYKLDQYISTDKPILLFLSHCHLDHIIGLHILNKFHFLQKFTIFGQIGTSTLLDQIIREPFTIPFDRLPYSIVIRELSEGHHSSPLSVECRYLRHSANCMGYRFNVDNKVVAYCTDTGLCDNLIHLGKGADLVITECSNIRGQRNESWPHLNPDDIVTILNMTQAKRLALMHFDANNYRSIEERFQINNYYPNIKERLLVTYDCLEIAI